MIARIWRGAVREEDGDAYAESMRKTGMAEYTSTPGNRGAWMLRRDIAEQTEFLMFTLWDSLDAVKAFAGDDDETAVFYAEDDRYLVARDPITTHYLVDTERGATECHDRDAAQLVSDHVAAFKARDVERLLSCLRGSHTMSDCVARPRSAARRRVLSMKEGRVSSGWCAAVVVRSAHLSIARSLP